jgi:hypothetical protein
LGSLYFATWSSFFISINLTATATQEFITDKNIRLVSGNDACEEPKVKETATAADDEAKIKGGAKIEETAAATDEEANVKVRAKIEKTAVATDEEANVKVEEPALAEK